MLSDWPSPPLSKTRSTSPPLCSELLSPSPQPFWKEGGGGCFLSASLVTWRCFAEGFCSCRRSTLEVICMQRQNSKRRKKPLLTFKELCFPRIYLQTFFFLTFAAVWSADLCTLVSVQLYPPLLLQTLTLIVCKSLGQKDMSTFWLQRAETELQPRILLGSKKAKQNKKKEKTKHHPSLCLVTNSTFCVASPALRLLLIHISPQSTFCLFSLALSFLFLFIF